MIKNIIFDMGQVLLKYDPPFFIKRVGVTDPEDTEILLREIYKSLEWSRMDRGSLTDEEAAEIMASRVPEHLKPIVRKLTCEWCRPILPVEGMADLVKELKDNGYKIYLLSNASHMQKTYWPNVPGSEYFDGRVVSAEEGLVKPQPEIYHLICNRYNLTPEECVFIDDATPNAEGAYYIGMHAIVFHGDVKETRVKLKELGVNVKVE